MPRSPLLLVALALAAAPTGPLAAQLDSTVFRRMEAPSIGPTGMSGRLGAIEALEANPDVVYLDALGNTGADTEDRGVHRSTDRGKTWRQVLYGDSLVKTLTRAEERFTGRRDIQGSLAQTEWRRTP